MAAEYPKVLEFPVAGTMVNIVVDSEAQEAAVKADPPTGLPYRMPRPDRIDADMDAEREAQHENEEPSEAQ